jgi:lipopolysaccharide export LptBFGC system permease protein LptF
LLFGYTNEIENYKNMKHIALYIALVIICFSFTQDDNLIFWQEANKLTWDDFKDKPNASSPYKAFTESEIKSEVAAKNNEAHITIKTFFDKNKSWVKDRTDELLAHEQLHFDITELWARKFRQKISGKTFSFKTFQKELKAIQSEIYKGSKDMQTDYDKETQHSIVVASQKKWEKKIKADIESLKTFATAEVSCTLTK